eukprot:97375_1
MGNLHHVIHRRLEPKSETDIFSSDIKTDRDPSMESVSSPMQSPSPSSILPEECTPNPTLCSLKSFICQSLSMDNGVAGKYISRRLVAVAAGFWINHIESLSTETKLEIGATMFFGMIASNKGVRSITKNHLSTDIKLKKHSLKFLEMIGYLMRNLVRDGIDFKQMLQELGAQHKRIGVQMHHFDVLICAIHETMSYYFPKHYDIDVQYAMEQVITISARIMNDTLLSRQNSMRRLSSFHGVNTLFLESLEMCLASDIGTEYFHRYLESQCCHEVSEYLKLMQKFHKQRTDQERCMVAKEIVKCCVDANGEYAVNISYETRKNLMDKWHKLEDEWLSLAIPTDYFEDVEMEMRRLIVKNHWMKFVEGVGSLRNSVSFVQTLNLLDEGEVMRDMDDGMNSDSDHRNVHFVQ